jgi:lipopolysaccharide biosynthesis glycosyltransferase
MSDSPKVSEAKDLIHVVLAVYDPKGTYSRHAGVVMTSMFEHTKSPVCVHILHDRTLTDDNRQRFSRTAERFGQKVRFIDVTEPFAEINRDGGMDKLSKSFTRGIFFRLLVPDLIDTEKVIYMDCDVVVNMDICELWNIPLRSSNCSIAAVIDEGIILKFQKKFRERIRANLLRLARDKYFNSGILLMDLERIRQKHNVMREAKTFFERFALLSKYPDQDFLNAAFKEDVLFIEGRFNRRIDDPYKLSESILHCTGTKPWQFPRDSARDKFYWETFMRSEWNDWWFEALRALSDNQYMHRRSSSCVKHLVRRYSGNLRRSFTASWARRFKLCWLTASELSRRILRHKS